MWIVGLWWVGVGVGFMRVIVRDFFFLVRSVFFVRILIIGFKYTFFWSFWDKTIFWLFFLLV